MLQTMWGGAGVGAFCAGGDSIEVTEKGYNAELPYISNIHTWVVLWLVSMPMLHKSTTQDLLEQMWTSPISLKPLKPYL